MPTGSSPCQVLTIQTMAAIAITSAWTPQKRMSPIGGGTIRRTRRATSLSGSNVGSKRELIMPSLPAGGDLHARHARVLVGIGGEPVVERVQHGLGARADPELVEDVAQVALDRARADPQLLGDLLVRQPGREQAQHRQLARAEGRLLRARRAAAHVPGEASGQL